MMHTISNFNRHHSRFTVFISATTHEIFYRRGTKHAFSAGELRKVMGTLKHRSFSLVFRIRLEVAISRIESMRLFVHKHSLYILHIV